VTCLHRIVRALSASARAILLMLRWQLLNAPISGGARTSARTTSKCRGIDNA
jgi:hypothetical protein